VFRRLDWAPSMMYKASHFSSFISYHARKWGFRGGFCSILLICSLSLIL